MPPPGGFLPPRKHEDILVYGNSLYIDFNLDGYFGPVEDNIFQDAHGNGIPSGQFTTGTHIGPFSAVSNDTEVDLVFVPTSTGQAHLETVKIRTPLP
jgi:hypothetical protein